MSRHAVSRPLVRFLFLVSCAFWACPSTAAATTAVERLSALLKNVDTLQAKFSYTSIDEEGGKLDSNSGHIALRRPGLFRWEVDPPYPQIIVSDRKSLWNYDPDFEQVIIKPYDDRLDQTPALLLSGDVSAIEENFDVQVLNDDGEELSFRLRPKVEGREFEHLEIVFNDGLLSSMSYADTLGQTFTYQFSDLLTNRPIADSTFVFEIPPGVEVLTDEQ